MPVAMKSNKENGEQSERSSGAPSEIDVWLEEVGLGRYASAFAENDIDLSLLPNLTDVDLRGLGIGSLGHRKRLLAAIEARSTAPRRWTLETVDAPQGERRQVTILFADLSGFTALSRSLDAEEVHELVARFTSLVDDVIVGYGGSIDKHIGDAVMALFGAPRAHDDDPVRAARAALDIHEALARWSENSGHPLKAHIGIASGEVVAGAVRRADGHDYTVLGDSVNLAARLVAAAAPGQTLLSEGVFRAIGGRGVCDWIGELQLKGIDAPVRVWRLSGISGDTAAGANRSVFVGREAELEQFRSILQASLGRRSGHVVYVRGEAGIGKTRLVEQMRSFAEARGFHAHRSLVLDFGVGRGQDPIRNLLQSLLDVSPASPSDEMRAVAEHLVNQGAITQQQLVFLNDVLDLPQVGEWRSLYEAMDNSARNRGKRAVATAVAAHACRGGPTLILVEDLHWADSQVLAYLSAIASTMTEGAGLLVMTSRNEGDPIDAAWRAACRSTPFATIDLGPLRPSEALSLAGGFIDTSQRLALACIERAAGNPLFLEQLLRNAEEGSEDVIPASIQSLVLARMDRLTPRDRKAFQTAAVIGQRFDLNLLRRLLDAPGYTCDALVANALVLPEGDDYLFAHALIQEGAYSSLLRSRRRELHLKAAEWFADHDPLLYAQHLDRAEDSRAPAAYLDAARAQRIAFRSDAALRLVDRGLEIAKDDGDRHALACLKGELLRDLGDIGSSIAIYRAAIAASPNEEALCRARIGLAEGLRVSEGLDEALALLNEAQILAERHAMTLELARLHHLRGNILFPVGNIEGCRQEHERGLAHARRSGSVEAEARALGGLADAAYAQGRMRTAFEHFSRCVALSREHGLGRIEVANLPSAGASRQYLNEVRQSRVDADEAARAAALVGQPRAEMVGELVSTTACLELGEYAPAKGYVERALRLARQLNARRFEANAMLLQAQILLSEGRRVEAAALLREALAICHHAGTQYCGPIVTSTLSLAVDDPAEREALLSEGARMLARGAVGHNHLAFHRNAIEAYLAAGDAERMMRHAAALEDYTRAEPLPWSTLFASRGRSLASVLRDGLSGGLVDELKRIRAELLSAGFKPYIGGVDAALTA
jgi:class 3 adenylate cyclase/tetratricopeptide (TPR) repeat protein